MNDTIIKGTHDSRSILGAQNIPESWPEALAMLKSTGWPIDMGPLNPLGCRQIGTGYTKAEVLPAELQGILNLSDFATPADAFKALYRNIYGSDETIYRWLRTRSKYVESQTKKSGYTTLLSISDPNVNITIQKADSVSVDPVTGQVSLNAPVQATHTYSEWVNSYKNYVYSQYFKVVGNNYIYKSDGCYLVSSDGAGSFLFQLNGTHYLISSTPSTTEQITEIVTSTDPNAYPVAGDGWTYTEIAPSPVIPPCTRAQSGSYVGTGTYGANNPNSLTFNFVPKLLMIPFAQRVPPSTVYTSPNFVTMKDYSWLIITDSLTTSPERYGLGYGAYAYAYVSADRKTVYWYTTSSDTTNRVYHQFNDTVLQYYYLAIS